MGEQLYFPIWKKRLADTLDLSEHCTTACSIQLHESLFNEAGNRKDYSFNLVLVGGQAVNDISGSAVARDLASVIAENKDAMARLQHKTIRINMNRHFTLNIQDQSL
ncbi:hypothetical protein DBR40_07455 [Pedobacter sp. KBW01]|uniref:hypothetical protein n=1 Tax=Pedobacter sp. KBW01 TaxID=2153364 RepID=UPI000F5994CF|nr:hypothetical protein [Pedobacter sp. KBW01]RQO77803.1 hypothetical protein DBR40_07455 [Pedobacter sp. KBW01]